MSLNQRLPKVKIRGQHYVSLAKNGLEQLQACASTMDLNAMARQAHDLKGMSGNFGIRRVQHLAEQLEHACQSESTAGIVQLLADIRQSLLAAEIILNAYFGSNK